MYTLYKMKADELNEDFLASLRDLFSGKTIEIAVAEAGEAEEDETAYLLKNPANRQRLMDAIENVERGRDAVTVNLDEIA